eukprot:1018949-Heterocapsa_arctica.AAC.1
MCSLHDLESALSPMTAAVADHVGHPALVDAQLPDKDADAYATPLTSASRVRRFAPDGSSLPRKLLMPFSR